MLRPITKVEFELYVIYAREDVMVQKQEKILFLGNSITRHGLASYWWGDWGMAAETRDGDYVHLFAAALAERGIEVDYEAFNFYGWEGMAHDRAETLQLLEPKLSPYLTLVVCQLGENVQQAEGLRADYEDLIAFIRSHAVRARILAVSPFWPQPEVKEAERLAAESMNVSFVDLSDIWGRQEYMCPDGYKVYGDDGMVHPVRHQGVLRHPGPKGHAEIASRLLSVWQELPETDAGNVACIDAGKVFAHSHEKKYVEVKPESTLQEKVYQEVGSKDIQCVIDGLKAYKAQAVAEHRFDTQKFLKHMEQVFEVSGYRQPAIGKQTEILIITDSGVGDFINLSASLREIRRVYEGAHIVLVSYARARALAEACPYIDELHLNSKAFNWHDFMSAFDWNADFVLRLLRHRFDMAFVFGTYPSAYLLAYMSGAKERISYGKDTPLCKGHPYAKFYPVILELLTVQLPYVVQSSNAVDSYLGILDNFFHAPVRKRNIEVWCLPGEVADLSEVIDRKFGGS